MYLKVTNIYQGNCWNYLQKIQYSFYKTSKFYIWFYGFYQKVVKFFYVLESSQNNENYKEIINNILAFPGLVPSITC